MKRLPWAAATSMAILAVALLAPAASPAAVHAGPGAPAAPAPNDQLFYALGVLLSQNLAAFELSGHEFRQVLEGFTDGYRHRAKLDDAQSFVRRLREVQHARQLALVQQQKAAGAAFLARIAAARGARRTPSGLVFVDLVPGTGATPTMTDRVTVRYTGKLVDGTTFDSSLRNGEPATLPLVGIIPCWREALQLMRVGGKAQVVCPSVLAYGDLGHLSVPPGATLDFQIELLAVLPGAVPPTPTPTPSER